jgi:hypothetical protein
MAWQTNGNSTSLFVCVTQGGKPTIAGPISVIITMMLGRIACVQYIRNFPGLKDEACIICSILLIEVYNPLA